MTKAQRLQVEQSERRQRLNELLTAETLTDEQRAEMDTLTKRAQQIEVELRAALVVEGQEEAEARSLFGNGDGEAGERGRLLEQTTIIDYLAPASAGKGIEGRAADLNAALELPTVGAGGGVPVPWDMIETRAFTTTTQNDGSERQCPILQRLFGPGIMDTLGVRVDTVPVGPNRVAADLRRRVTRTGERGHRGVGGCACNVLIRNIEAEAPDRAVRIHPRTGCQRSRPGAGVCGATSRTR